MAAYQIIHQFRSETKPSVTTIHPKDPALRLPTHSLTPLPITLPIMKTWAQTCLHKSSFQSTPSNSSSSKPHSLWSRSLNPPHTPPQDSRGRTLCLASAQQESHPVPMHLRWPANIIMEARPTSNQLIKCHLTLTKLSKLACKKHHLRTSMGQRPLHRVTSLIFYHCLRMMATTKPTWAKGRRLWLSSLRTKGKKMKKSEMVCPFYWAIIKFGVILIYH